MKIRKVLLALAAGLMISPLAAIAATDTKTADVSFTIPATIVLNIDSGDVAAPVLADVSIANMNAGEVNWITTGVLAVDATENWKLEVASTLVTNYFGGTGNATKALSDLSVSIDAGTNYVSLNGVDATTPVVLITSGVGLGVPGVGITMSAIQYKLALNPALDVAGSYTANLTFTATTI